MLRLACLFLLFALPARADVADSVNLIATGYAGFADAAVNLADKSRESCDPATLQPAFHAAFDAWLNVAHIRIGPVEQDGRALAIAFWPDPKSLGAKAQRTLMTGDPALLEPASFAQQSVAARGLMGLERLLYPKGALPADPCPLIRATAHDLARMAADLSREWPAFGALLSTAGTSGNTAYLTVAEARQALFTQIATGIAFVADNRIGRPLGSFDKPRPERAEARASDRSLRNVILSMQALERSAQALAPESAGSIIAFQRVQRLAAAVGDPAFAGIDDPQNWLKLEILQQAVHSSRDIAVAEISASLGVDLGFNAQDGD